MPNPAGQSIWAAAGQTLAPIPGPHPASNPRHSSSTAPRNPLRKRPEWPPRAARSLGGRRNWKSDWKFLPFRTAQAALFRPHQGVKHPL